MQERRRRRSDRAAPVDLPRCVRRVAEPPVAGRAESSNGSGRRSRRGLSSEDAAVSCGVSPPVGHCRWFREGGARPMPPISLAPRQLAPCPSRPAGRDRDPRAQPPGMRDIARRLRESNRRLSRGELRRNARLGAAVWRIGRRLRSGTRRTCQAPEDPQASRELIGSGATCRTTSRARSMAEDGTPAPGPTRGLLERPTSWPPPGPTLGEIVQPAADRPFRLDGDPSSAAIDIDEGLARGGFTKRLSTSWGGGHCCRSS